MMPVANDENENSWPSVQQLKSVFNLCDPNRTGKVKVEYLQELAKLYSSNDSMEVEVMLKLFDPHEKGEISFREFYRGVRTVQRRRCQAEKCTTKKESMMSPVSDRRTGLEVPRLLETVAPDTTITNTTKSSLSSLSDGESYECYGEGGDMERDAEMPTETTNGVLGGSKSPLNNNIKRNTWARSSLRKSPSSHEDGLPNRRWGSFRHSAKRQLGSNVLANQLFRSSSFNSSGRSSTCDTGDDMYSDASLEEDVLDLNHKLQILQQQVGVLTDSASHTDERYTRAKAENAALQARVHMLEEQLRETEIRHENRLQDEQRRAKELLVRVEREKQRELENCTIRLNAAELEVCSLREEAARQRGRAERLEAERRELSEQLQDVRGELANVLATRSHSLAEQERRLTQDRDSCNQLIEELSREVERLRSEARTPALPTTSPETLRLEELHQEVASLRSENKSLLEANEELQASLLTAGVEQGRLLTAGETSLAAELEAMSHDQHYELEDHESFVKIQQALKEQQDVNSQLRSYIDGILLNIVENYPQLLEVKQRSA